MIFAAVFNGTAVAMFWTRFGATYFSENSFSLSHSAESLALSNESELILGTIWTRRNMLGKLLWWRGFWKAGAIGTSLQANRLFPKLCGRGLERSPDWPVENVRFAVWFSKATQDRKQHRNLDSLLARFAITSNQCTQNWELQGAWDSSSGWCSWGTCWRRWKLVRTNLSADPVRSTRKPVNETVPEFPWFIELRNPNYKALTSHSIARWRCISSVWMRTAAWADWKTNPSSP